MNKELFTFEQLSCTVSLPWSSTHYHIILLIQDPCWYTTQMIETTHNPCEPDVTSRRAGAGQSCTLHTPCPGQCPARQRYVVQQGPIRKRSAELYQLWDIIIHVLGSWSWCVASRAEFHLHFTNIYYLLVSRDMWGGLGIPDVCCVINT